MGARPAAPADASGPAVGFDETLFEELARMTPDERLEHNDRMVAAILELRDAFASAAPEDAARAAGGKRH